MDQQTRALNLQADVPQAVGELAKKLGLSRDPLFSSLKKIPGRFADRVILP